MIYHGQKTVTTAGTAVPLTSSTLKCYTFTVQPLSTNVGQVRIGGRLVTAPTTVPTAIATGYGLALNPGDSGVGFPSGVPGQYDLATILLDADNNSDGVQFIAVK